MLQQTRVAQGTPYYIKFIEEFPTVYDLADASEEKVLRDLDTIPVPETCTLPPKK